MAFWSLKPAPLSVLFEVTPEEDWDLPKKKRTKVQVIWRYWVRKLPKLVIVEGKDKNGNRVLCYTDAYFYYTKHNGDELVKEEAISSAEEILDMQAAVVSEALRLLQEDILQNR